MKAATLTAGTHAFLAVEGGSYAAGTLPPGPTSRDSKPASTDAAWIYTGVISLDEIENTAEEREVFAPSPGVQRKFDVIRQRQQLNFTITFEQFTRATAMLLFGTETTLLNDAQTQFNPLEGPTIRGWLKIQKYDQNDDLWLVVDVWAYLKVAAAVSMGDDIIRTQVQAQTLQSSLNTGQLLGLLG